MRLSVVIICWNSLPQLRQLLDSLPEALEGIDSEVIVVDNGSTDSTADFMASRWPSMTCLHLDRNYGVAYARNRGIERARGEFVWLLDDDTVVNREAIDAMLAYMDATPLCGICACALHDFDGNVQRSYKPFPGLGAKVRNLLGCRQTDPYAGKAGRGEPFEPVYVIGACQLIRREVFDLVGLLDQHIFYGPEDADFCLRVSKAGRNVVYLPYVSVVHKWKRITTRRPLSKTGRAHIRALLYFWAKHRRL